MIWDKIFFDEQSHYLETADQRLRKEPWKLDHSMKKFQKFLSVVDRHEKSNFFTFMIFLAPAIFWSVTSEEIDQKMTGAKKVFMIKNQFSHVCWPCKIFQKLVHIVAFFLRLYFETLISCFQIMGLLIKKILAQIITDS